MCRTCPCTKNVRYDQVPISILLVFIVELWPCRPFGDPAYLSWNLNPTGNWWCMHYHPSCSSPNFSCRRVLAGLVVKANCVRYLQVLYQWQHLVIHAFNSVLISLYIKTSGLQLHSWYHLLWWDSLSIPLNYTKTECLYIYFIHWS